ncbi:MAG: GNAT family N-acetyltransferase [Myxococcales bacterium]|nr:GNAT family N-acetyltransferase [Myxococcales bacterium]
MDLRAVVALGVRLLVVHDGLPGKLPFPGTACPPKVATLQALWDAGRVPCVTSSTPFQDGAHLARELGAQRLLCMGPTVPPSRRGQIGLREIPAEARARNPALWTTLEAFASGPGCAAVVLARGAGAVFAELFTHHGSGLMLGHALAEGVRPAHPGDAADIFLLLRDDVHRGAIRPVDEHGVAETLEQHLVYVIDGVVVGTARLIPHGDRAELSRFATLPRYRGRGRARALGEALIDRARAQGYAGVFALSIEARMWGFFESLGMSPADRATLPESWLAGYDLSRPSRAYALAF